jgi:phosphoserine phosphatase RsbX
METPGLTLVEWGVASRAAHDGVAIGDTCLIQPRRRGVLVAAIDALGHGPDAAATAAAAREVLAADGEATLLQLLHDCHARLHGTRGVAMSMAMLDEEHAAMSWLGVGNVEGLLVRDDPVAGPREAGLLLRNGIVGRTLPPVRVETLPVATGDTLVFATDGIVPDFDPGLLRQGHPQQRAEILLDRHYRGNDDGLVMVAVVRRGGS